MFRGIRKLPGNRAVSQRSAVQLCQFLVFLCVSFVSFSFASAQSAGGLSQEQCQQLYAKQLYLATESGVLTRALELNQKGLVAPTTVQAEIAACRSKVSNRSYQCQMKAESFLDILLCHSTNQDGQSLSAIMDRFRKLSTEDSSQDPGNSTATDGPGATDTGASDPAEPGVARADAEQCKAAYESMLRIYSNSEYLKQDPDRKKLLESWQRESSRISFQSRCVQRFKESDANCLAKAGNAEDIQNCLAVIPPV